MKKLTKFTPKSSVNQHSLEVAYDLVITDLFHFLKKLKDGDSIQLGELGTLHKKKRILRSALHRKTYVYYQISFKASNPLKKELDK
jgi:hypothetical protein